MKAWQIAFLGLKTFGLTHQTFCLDGTSCGVQIELFGETVSEELFIVKKKLFKHKMKFIDSSSGDQMAWDCSVVDPGQLMSALRATCLRRTSLTTT